MSYELELCIIKSRKFDGTIHREWKAKQIEQKANLLGFVGKFDKDIIHSELGFIRRGTISYEFYWLDRGYNIFRFHEPAGELRNFYCNLSLPPVFKDNVLDYIDLDLDVLVRKDFSFKILDSEEFEENTQKFNYSSALLKDVDKNLQELLCLIERRDFPFDYKS